MEKEAYLFVAWRQLAIDSWLLLLMMLLLFAMWWPEQAMGQWVNGSNGSLFSMGHMGHGSRHGYP